MSVYYEVKEHVVLKNEATEALSFDVAESLAQIAYKMLLDRAAIWELKLTADGKKYSFKGKEVTHELHEIIRAITNAAEIDMVIEYDAYNFDFPLMEAISETLENNPELAKDISYTIYNKADYNSGAGCLSAFGAKDVVVYSGSLDSETVIAHLDGEWISADTSVVFDDDITEDMDVEMIKKCAQDFADMDADIQFREDKLELFVNSITLKSLPGVKRFIDIYNALNRATCGKCGYIADFVDKTQADTRVMIIDFDKHPDSFITISET